LIVLTTLTKFLLNWQGPFITLPLHLSSSATIDSPTDSNPVRDLLPSTVPLLPLDPITSSNPRPSQTSITSRTSLPPPLVPATRSRSELEQGNSSSSVGALSSFHT
ncbi:uncharacterized protein LACBIDRAFT_171150, partial [Laccaria bicolor S238N-H82]